MITSTTTKIKFLVPFLFFPCFSLAGDLGQTYSIKEPDALIEIQEQSKKIDFKNSLKVDSSTVSNSSIFLPKAELNATRFHKRMYTSPFDVRSHDGTLIYPKGYTFNVLDYVKMPYRVIIFNNDTLHWAKSVSTKTDVLILADKGIFKAQSQFTSPVYALDKKTIEALSIRFASTIISQVGNQLKIVEFEVKPDET